MKKLIRDRYINTIDKKELDIIGNAVEHRDLLIDKLFEEIDELAESDYKDIEEYADVIEVLRALAEINGINFTYVEAARIEKLYEKGGFKTGLILNRPNSDDK